MSSFGVSKAVAGVINKFAENYLESVDGSQLQLDLFKQKGHIQNVFFKPTALDGLNLPIKLNTGHVGSLTIDFPLTNIWSGKWKLELVDVSILVQPAKVEFGTVEQEREDEYQKKMKEVLLRETISIQDDGDSSFTERLSAKVLENLDVTIRNLHIRYEDSISIRNESFAVGIKFNEIKLCSAPVDNEGLHGLEGLCKKVGGIEKFSIYLETKLAPTKLISNLISREQKLAELKKRVLVDDSGSILGPVSCSAGVILCMQPWKNDWEQPKSDVNLVITELNIGLSKSQFQTIYLLGQTFDVWAKGLPYRRFHPGLTDYRKENSRKWWKFAITSVLHDVKKKREVWSWEKHIQPNMRHRKNYRTLYEKQLRGTRLSEKEQKEIKEAEYFLSSWNLLRERKLAQDTVELEKKVKAEENAGWSITSWFFGKKNETETRASADSAVDQIQMALRSESEQEALREALEMTSESQSQFPKKFRSLVVDFAINRFNFLLRNDELGVNVFHMLVDGMEFGFSARPAADSVWFSSTLNNFMITNGQDGEDCKVLTERHNATSEDVLLSLEFETNPDDLDISCDQKLIVKALPLDVYFSLSVLEEAKSIFQPPNQDEFSELKAQAEQAVGAVQQSLAALEYSRKTKAMKIYLDVNLEGSFVIFPELGIYRDDCSCVVADLGTFKMKSIENTLWQQRRKSESDIKDFQAEAAKIIAESYDIYQVDIEDVKVVSVFDHEDWPEQLTNSGAHILTKTNLSVNVKVTALKDIRAPKLIVSGSMPTLHVNLVDDRISDAIAVFQSMSPPPTKREIREKRRAAKVERRKRSKGKAEGPAEQSFLEATFALGTLRIDLNHFSGMSFQPIAVLNIHGVELGATMLEAEQRFKFAVKSIDVLDESRAAVVYKTILSHSESERALDLDVTMFSLRDEDLSNPELYHMSVKLVGASLRVIFLNRFVQQLVSFASRLSVSKQAVVGVSQVAADEALANLKELYKSQIRIKLDVTLNAPIILVPKGSSDHSFTLVNLGQLRVKNRFEHGQQNRDSPLFDNPMFDCISVKLRDCKLSLGLSDNEGRIKSECYLLEPISFKTHVRRSLSKWDVTAPEISIDAKLAQISVALCQSDIPKLQEILDANLTEVDPLVIERGDDLDDASSMISDWSVSTEQSEASLLADRVKIEAKVVLEGFKCELFSGCTSLREGLARRDASTSFAVCRVLDLVGSFKLKNDGALDFSSELKGIELVNSSITTKVFHRKLVEPQTIPGSESAPMLDVRGSKYPEGFFDVEVKFSGLNTVVCLPYYMNLLSFLTFKPSEESPAPKDGNEPSGGKGSDLDESKLKVRVTMQKNVQLMLVESLTDPDAYAITAQIMAEMTASKIGPSTHLDVTIDKLALFSCMVDPDKRKATKGEILQAIKCDLTLDVDGEQAVTEVRCMVQSLKPDKVVRLNVTPGTIDLFVRAIGVVLTGDETEQESAATPDDLSDLFRPSPVTLDELPGFVKVDKASEISEDYEISASQSPAEEVLPPVPATEVLTIAGFLVELNVEAGLSVGPLLRVEIGVLETQVENWSQNLTANMNVSMQARYYSDRSNWMVFLVEPVPYFESHVLLNRPFQFSLKAERNPPALGGSGAISSSTKIIAKPEWSFSAESSDALELTATNSLLDVLNTLGEAFGDTKKKQLTSQDRWSALHIVSDSPVDVKIRVDESGYVDEDRPNQDHFVMKPRSEKSLTSRAQTDGKLVVYFSDHRFELMTKDDFINVVSLSGGEEVVVECSKSLNSPKVSFRGRLQMVNHTKKTVHVYTVDKSDRQLDCCGTLEPCSKLNVPEDVLASGCVYLVPEGDHLFDKVAWRGHDAKSRIVECKSKKGGETYYAKVVIDKQEIPFFQSKDSKTFQTTTIHICPTIVFVNQLPITLTARVVGSRTTVTAKPGELVRLDNYNGSAQLAVTITYMGVEYLCQKASTAICGTEAEVVWDFDAVESASLSRLVLYSLMKPQHNSPHVYVHAKFWIQNATSLTLSCKNEGGDETFVPPDEIVIFHPKSSTRTSVRLGYKNSWSDLVRLDAPGSDVVFKVKAGEAFFLVGGTISMVSSGMTFKVVLSAGIQLVNNTRYPLMYDFQEIDLPDSPMDDKFLKPKSTKGIWPRYPEKTQLSLRPHGSLDGTSPISLVPGPAVLLPVKGLIGALFVEYGASNATITLFISEYSAGLAPWMILNLSGVALVYGQKDGTRHIIGPSQKVLFGWETAIGNRTLTIESDYGAITLPLHQEREDQLRVMENQSVFWQTFVLNQQWMILISDDPEVLSAVSKVDQLGKPQMVFRLQLEAVGVSLVDEEKRREIAYANIFRPSKWQYKSKAKHQIEDSFKNFSDKDSDKLERLHRKGKILAQVDLQKFGNVSVRFDDMELLLNGEKREIRPAFRKGLSAEMTTLNNGFRQISLIAAAVQIDNHMEGSLYPVVMFPVPHSKTVAAISTRPPFMEVVYIDRASEGRPPTDIVLEVVLQDLIVNVELPFIVELVNFVGQTSVVEKEREEKRVTSIQRDMAFINAAPSLTGQRTFFRLVKVETVRAQLSFSLSNVQTEMPEFIAFVLRTVNITSFSDAVLGLDYFQRLNTHQSREQLIQELTSHYTTQVLTQVYKIALGLDILGNPLKFVSGFGSGVESFVSEPIEGAMQGAEEFAEGIAIGTRRLFAGTVGGAAAALGTIAGALASGATAMTFDRRHQIERREQKIAKAKGQTGLPAMAGNVTSFFGNVASGVTGVVMQPVDGARREGASGFFKGVGKGLVGLVARPVAAVADLAADTFKTVETVAGARTALKRQRLTRFVPRQGVEPYCQWKAEGYGILKHIDRGSHESETYVFHTEDNQHNTLLVTKNRLLYLKKTLTQDWEVIWEKPVTMLARSFATGVVVTFEFQDRRDVRIGFDTEQIAEWVISKMPKT